MTIASISQAVITLEPKNLKRWTVQDYHRISELGILIADRTELIEGQITIMAAKGTPHVTSLHPSPEQIYLVVEVADFTLKQNCEIKDKLYAKAGIDDYWVLAPQKRQLHIFRKPTSTGYSEHLILTEPNQASLLVFPDFAIALTSILPPIS